MKEIEEKREQFYEVDVFRMIKALWRHAWLVILAALIAGGAGFCYAKLVLTPTYKASVLMYVNNSAISVSSSGYTISSGQITAAERLVDTYLVILSTRNTLDQVAQEADVDYSYEKLSSMITADSVNGTEIFRITVTASQPEEAKMLANTVAKVLPKAISDVVYGSDVRVVDRAVTPTTRSSPSYTRYTTIGLVAGALLSVLAIMLLDAFDDVIHDSDYLTQTYDAPLLTMIPDLMHESDASSAYGYGYGYGYGDDKKGA